MPVTLIGITFVVFCLTRMVPGGPVDRILQEQAIGALCGEHSSGSSSAMVSEPDIERLEEIFNLQEPVWLAYLQWLGIRRRIYGGVPSGTGDPSAADTLRSG